MTPVLSTPRSSFLLRGGWIAAALSLTILGCAETGDKATIDKPVFSPVAFTDLHGWNADEHAKALKALLNRARHWSAAGARLRDRSKLAGYLSGGPRSFQKQARRCTAVFRETFYSRRHLRAGWSDRFNHGLLRTRITRRPPAHCAFQCTAARPAARPRDRQPGPFSRRP